MQCLILKDYHFEIDLVKWYLANYRLTPYDSYHLRLKKILNNK